MNENEKIRQLYELMDKCSSLDIDLRHEPQEKHFTALVWEGWEYPHNDAKALTIQKQIQKMTNQYPDLVCYCFDPYSTLVYTV